MPIYVYSCTKCNKKPIEVEHSMKFVGEENKLPKDILKKITCAKHKTLMSRVPQEPQLAGAAQGQFQTEKQLLAQKQKQKKIRSRIHFKNDVLKTLPLGPGEKRHFDKKLKHLPNKDHEKMK